MDATAQETKPTSAFWSDALDVFNIVHEPAAVFARIRDRARVLAPWIVISVLLVVTTYLMRPYQAAATEAFRATLPPDQAASVPSGGSLLGLAFVPLFAYVAFVAGAGLLWIGVSLLGTQARFTTLMSVLAYSYISYIVFSAVTIAVLLVRGTAEITSFVDVRAPLGLDLLAPGAGLYVGGVLNGINPFSVWGVWLVGTGIAVTHGTARAGSIVVTTVAYVIGLLVTMVPLLFVSLATRQ